MKLQGMLMMELAVGDVFARAISSTFQPHAFAAAFAHQNILTMIHDA